MGESIELALEPYAEATLSVVDAGTVLPPRDQLDREGGAFVWDRSEDQLLLIEGVRDLYLAPGLTGGRPIGIALTADLEIPGATSVVVRLEPLEVVALPVVANVRTELFEAVWDDPTTVRVTFSEPLSFDGRQAPDGEYTLDLETATLTLVRTIRRGTSASIDVEQTWWSSTAGYTSMIVQNGQRTLRRGDGGLGEELAGHVRQWAESADGGRVAMVAERSELLVYDFERDRRVVVGGPADYGSVDWSPDGRYLAVTVFGSLGQPSLAAIFDVEPLRGDVPPPDRDNEWLVLPPLENVWSWQWRNATELFVGGDGTLWLLEIASGELRAVLDDRQPYDTLAWNAATSTLAHSRLRGVPVSILELGEAGGWFDLPLLAASPHVGLFDMNWGGGGQWLALNTAPGRS